MRLRISLFYDGTGNNRTNTAERVARSPTYRRHSSGDDSYEADASNVAEIERLVLDRAQGFDEYLHVYTEGIGTTTRGADDTEGFALGTGTTGVVRKVERGIAEAVTQLSKRTTLQPRDTRLDVVAVDTCGFSRGAAAARHAVHQVLYHRWAAFRLKNRLEALGFEVGRVYVDAVGLFDTVSSYGIRHANDVAELQLDAIRHAQAVYHLAAAEEYRDNFSLTNIASAGGRGTEVYLPGAHSDVGGGYRDGAPEVRNPLMSGSYARPVAEFMLARGWFRGGMDGPELVFTAGRGPTLIPPRRATLDRVTTRRGPLPTRYTFIPRRLMARWLRDRGIPIAPRLFRVYTTDGIPWGPQIEQRALTAQDRTPDYWERPSTGLAVLRNGFLHVSFRAESAAGGLVHPHAVRLADWRGRPQRRIWTNG